jgi:hypothetical protein
VRDGLDTRSQPYEDAPDARRRRSCSLPGGVEDHKRLRLGRGAQLLARLVVSVEHDSIAGNAGCPCEGELAERGDVGADTVLREQPQQRDVGERLRPVDDQRARRRLAVLAHAVADRLLAIDEERRSMLLRQPRRRHTADRELPAVDPRRFRKEFEHLASIGIPMPELLLT